MKTVTARLESTSPYSQSRHYSNEIERGGRGSGTKTESANDYEARTWRNRMHATEAGEVFIPPMAFKNCLSEAAKFLGQQIPGKGKATYTKHFEAGVMVIQPLLLGVDREKVDGEWLFVPANGRRGDGKRVLRCFPLIREWSGDVEFLILDDVISPDVFEQHLNDAGNFIGIGRFRPRNNGYYGRFKVTKLTWG